MGNITPEEINMASMLIQLGVTTFEAIQNLFASKGNDDAVLAAVMAEVTARITRRS
jgi:hypothetical protein